MKTLSILPGEGLFMRVEEKKIPQLIPKLSSNVKVMHKEPADEAIVIVKREADEGMVTYWRVKLLESSKD
jgi:hypothetical protein